MESVRRNECAVRFVNELLTFVLWAPRNNWKITLKKEGSIYSRYSNQFNLPMKCILFILCLRQWPVPVHTMCLFTQFLSCGFKTVEAAKKTLHSGY